MEADHEHINPFASPLAEETNQVSGAHAADGALEQIRRDNLSREASIQSIGSLYVLGALVMTLATGSALVTLVFATVSADVVSGGGGFVGITSIFYVAMTAAFWWIGLGLRRLNPAVRIWAIILSAIGLLGFPIGTLINGYVLWLVSGRKAKYIFSSEYQDIIAATPHIKYKTSIVVWILLAVLVAVLVVGIAAAISAG